MFCLSSIFESLAPSLSPFQFASDATSYCIFQTNDECNLNLYIFMHYNNTCDSVRSYFLKAQNEKKSNYPLCWVKRVCFINNTMSCNDILLEFKFDFHVPSRYSLYDRFGLPSTVYSGSTQPYLPMSAVQVCMLQSEALNKLK